MTFGATVGKYRGMDTNEQKPGAHGAGDSKPFGETVATDFGKAEERVACFDGASTMHPTVGAEHWCGEHTTKVRP